MQNLKEILEVQHNREFSISEVEKAESDIKIFAEIIFKITVKNLERLQKLKEFPLGFHLTDSDTCVVCGKVVVGEKSWYDKNGVKCMICQNAINTKIIPVSIIKKRESWYSAHELNSFFNIQSADLRRYIKQNFLKQRTILNDSNKIHLQLFLIADNKDVLPPKNLLKSRIVKVERKGEEFYTSEEWYEYIDKKLLQKLMKYRIVECFRESFSKPINLGKIYYKEVNPLFTIKN